MQQIRVCTHEGPGAKPVIRTVPWPDVGKKAALIKVGACGVCGTDLHILGTLAQAPCRGRSRSATRSPASSWNVVPSWPRTSWASRSRSARG